MTEPTNQDRPHGWFHAVIERIGPIGVAVIFVVLAFTTGMSAGQLIDDQTDLPTRLTDFEKRITDRMDAMENALNALNQVDGISVRLRMTEETLCTQERRDQAGVDRDRYCEVLRFIRENGLPTPSPRKP